MLFKHRLLIFVKLSLYNVLRAENLSRAEVIDFMLIINHHDDYFVLLDLSRYYKTYWTI